RQLDLERVVARLIARLARAVGVGIALAEAVADVALPLPHAALVLAAEAEARDVDLRQRDRHLVLALAPDELALRDVLAQVLLDLPAHDVAEAAVVGVDPEGHQITRSMKRWLVGSYTPRRRPCRLAARPWSSIPRARVSTA